MDIYVSSALSANKWAFIITVFYHCSTCFGADVEYTTRKEENMIISNEIDGDDDNDDNTYNIDYHK